MAGQLLRRSLVPVHGEAIDAYLERLAWRLQAPIVDLLHLVGLASSRGYDALPRALTVQLSDVQAAAFSAATGVTRDELRTMTLAQYDGICVSFRGYSPGQGQAVRALAVREWISPTSSWICPLCLADRHAETAATGIWQMRWRLPWSYACEKHQLLLVRECPQCQLPFRSGGRRGSVPAFSARLLEPGVCRNSVRPQGRRQSHPCGHPYTRSLAHSLRGETRTLRASSTFSAVLESREATLFGSSASALDYFAGARSLAALVLTLATSDDLGLLAGPANAAFDDYVKHRARHGRRRPYTTVPRDPALVAAISPFIVELLSATQPSDAAAMIRPLLERLPKHQRPANLARNICLPPILRPVLDHALARRASLRSGLIEQVQSSDLDAAARVPQLLWADPFQRDFEALLPNTKRNFARRFCSLAIVCHLLACDWLEAAALLDLPERRSCALAYTYAGRLKQQGTEAEFIARVQRLADDVRQDVALPNLARRREILSQLPEIPMTTWREICRTAGVTAGSTARRRFAAAWLWCDLTGGDYQLAPQLVAKVAGKRHPAVTSYGRFIKSHEQLLTRVVPGLRSYGAALLER